MDELQLGMESPPKAQVLEAWSSVKDFGWNF